MEDMKIGDIFIHARSKEEFILEEIRMKERITERENVSLIITQLCLREK